MAVAPRLCLTVLILKWAWWYSGSVHWQPCLLWLKDAWQMRAFTVCPGCVSLHQTIVSGAALCYRSTAKAFPAVMTLCQFYRLCAYASIVIMLDVTSVSTWSVCVLGLCIRWWCDACVLWCACPVVFHLSRQNVFNPTPSWQNTLICQNLMLCLATLSAAVLLVCTLTFVYKTTSWKHKTDLLSPCKFSIQLDLSLLWMHINSLLIFFPVLEINMWLFCCYLLHNVHQVVAQFVSCLVGW